MLVSGGVQAGHSCTALCGSVRGFFRAHKSSRRRRPHRRLRRRSVRRLEPIGSAENTALLPRQNESLSYRLDIRVDPERKHLAGTNTIRFRMLADTTASAHLYDNLAIERDPARRHVARVRTELNTFRQVSRHLESRPDLRPSTSATRAIRANREVRWDRLPSGSQGPALDQHRVRRRGREHRWTNRTSGATSRGDGAARRRTQPPGRRLPTAVRRKTESREATTCGTGTSISDQTTTTSRSTSGTTHHFADRRVTSLDFFVLPAAREGEIQFSQAKPRIERIQAVLGRLSVRQETATS